jgi:hypothetical protein
MGKEGNRDKVKNGNLRKVIERKGQPGVEQPRGGNWEGGQSGQGKEWQLKEGIGRKAQLEGEATEREISGKKGN